MHFAVSAEFEVMIIGAAVCFLVLLFVAPRRHAIRMKSKDYA